MNKQIILRNKTVAYTLKKSWRTKRMRLSVAPGGAVAVSIPGWIPVALAEKFMEDKAEWLLSKIERYRNVAPAAPRRTRADYLKHKESARKLIETKTRYFANILCVKYNRISVRNQKTCWGSCSRRNNLNFNYKILFLAEETQNYIIVHELCHLKEFNHSKKFWAHVAEINPDYFKIRKELKSRMIGLG